MQMDYVWKPFTPKQGCPKKNTRHSAHLNPCSQAPTDDGFTITDLDLRLVPVQWTESRHPTKPQNRLSAPEKSAKTYYTPGCTPSHVASCPKGKPNATLRPNSSGNRKSLQEPLGRRPAHALSTSPQQCMPLIKFAYVTMSSLCVDRQHG